jgi:hypothetical protein
MTIKPAMVLLGTILALALALRSPARAGDSTPAPAASGKAVAPRPAQSIGQEFLISSLIQWRPCCTGLAAGFNRAFTTTITCAHASCTFGFEDMIAVSPTSDPWAICAAVNNTFVFTPACPFQGPGLSSTRTSLQSFGPVGPGRYTLTVWVYVASPTKLEQSEAIYRLYTP